MAHGGFCYLLEISTFALGTYYFCFGWFYPCWGLSWKFLYGSYCIFSIVYMYNSYGMLCYRIYILLVGLMVCGKIDVKREQLQ